MLDTQFWVYDTLASLIHFFATILLFFLKTLSNMRVHTSVLYILKSKYLVEFTKKGGS